MRAVRAKRAKRAVRAKRRGSLSPARFAVAFRATCRPPRPSAMPTLLTAALTLTLTLTLAFQAPAATDVRDRQDVRKLVLANTYGLHWSPLSGTPTGEVALFLGSSLRPLLGRRGRILKSAVGYEIGVSVGGADRATSILSWGGDYGVLYHRHHITALGYGGPNDRLFYLFGGGVMFWRTTPVALEADARLGVVLGVRNGSRAKGVVGGHVRLVGILGGVPLPHLGVFAGLFLF